MAEGFSDARIMRELSRLEDMTVDVKNTVDRMSGEMTRMNKNMSQMSEELRSLSAAFYEMMEEQQRTVALQQATTELVRVRQELEQKFGGYQIVRDTMLGVLQATDSALVKKTTIARVSEELMISTPEYWLAPCLVAVAAWISNNRELADRAIVEAVKRDEERTALTMALICRRNNRVQTCYEWLAIYFSKQKAMDISETSYAYIDAYINGVFGPDEKHMCDDYIARWIEEIRDNSEEFEKEQEELWKNYYASFRRPVDGQYPALKASVAEYSEIDKYLGRVHSIETIKSNFEDIANAPVDQEHLKEVIDDRLVDLIKTYDPKEMPLRREEARNAAIKKCRGDVKKAEQVVRKEAERNREKRLNLVEQMSNAIKTDSNDQPSKRKTAISFLRGYINKGFEEYAKQDKEAFPNGITMNVNGWVGTTVDGSNINELYGSYGAYIKSGYDSEIQKATSQNPNIAMIGGIACAILAIIFLIISPVVGILFGIGSIVCFVNMVESKKNMKKNVEQICAKYNGLTYQGNQQIQDCVEQWKKAKAVANEFASKPVSELIA